MRTITEYGNMLLRSNYILQRNEDGSGEIYIENPGEFLRVKEIYADIESDQVCGLTDRVITGLDFLRVRGEHVEQVPKSDFRHVSARVLNRIELKRKRDKIRDTIRRLHETPRTIEGRVAMY